MQAVILAGGLATRLGPLARELPKSLVPVAGRPFLAWQLERIRRSGFDEVLLCIGHLGSAVRAFAGDGAAFGLRVDYSEDGDRLLGTAGALRQASSRLAPEFLVTYGDSYLPFDYSGPLVDLRAHEGALGTMSVFKNDGRWDASNTSVQGELVTRYEKGASDATLDHIDYGATALRRSVIEALPPATPHELHKIQTALARERRLRAYYASERFYEIGSPAGLRELDAVLAAGHGRT